MSMSIYRLHHLLTFTQQCVNCGNKFVNILARYAAQSSAANFSKFRRPVCQIPRLNAANFPHIAINFLQPLNATKYMQYLSPVTATDRYNSLSTK